MLARRVFVVGLAGLLLACAGPDRQPEPGPALVWPAPPEPARIAYVQSIETAADLGIGKGLWQRLGDLLFGAENLRLVRPMAALEAAGVVYVADPGATGVHRFDRLRSRHDIVRRERGLPLPSPVALAARPDGTVLVSDSALRQVFEIVPGSTVARPLALGAELRQPTGLAWDAAGGRLFVADTAAHRVRVFGADGQPAGEIGRRGTGEGEFNYPTMLWHDGRGHLFVSDSLNFRVQVFDDRGVFESQFGRAGDGSGDMARHKGIATDRQGHVYVVDSLLHAMQVFDRSGRLLLGVGAQGRDAGEFWLPAGLFIGADDRIYVADAYNRRVQVFRYVGGDW